MSLFDVISSSVSSLFDGDTSGATDAISESSGSDWLGAAKQGIAAFGTAQKQSESKLASDEALLRHLFFQTTENSMNQKFPVSKSRPAVSADPQDIQRAWMSYLQGVADPSSVPGKLYKAGGAN